MDPAKPPWHYSLRYMSLVGDSHKALMANTRIGFLDAAEKLNKAATVADMIGGAEGAELRSNVDQLLSNCLLRLGDDAGAARAAYSSIQAARASGSRTMLVTGLFKCGVVASDAAGEMANAEREGRDQERLGGSPLYGGLDLSQEGRVDLPTTPAALSRLALAYNEAAVRICEDALKAVGGRGSPAATNDRRVPNLQVEAQARGFLGICLDNMGEQRQRSLELLRQGVSLWRLLVRTVAPGQASVNAQRGLTDDLSTLGCVLNKTPGSDGMAEAEACLREALALGEGLEDVLLTLNTLRRLVNLCGQAHAAVGPAEAEAFRSRLNQLLVQMGRSHEASCSICLEPLAMPADGAVEDAAGDGGSGGAGGPPDSCVRVLGCDHQFHHGCLNTWWRTTSNYTCPICKK